MDDAKPLHRRRFARKRPLAPVRRSNGEKGLAIYVNIQYDRGCRAPLRPQYGEKETTWTQTKAKQAAITRIRTGYLAG